MTLEASVPPWHQGLYPSVEETDVKHLQPGANSLYQVSLSCKSLTSHVLLMGSKGMEVTGCGTGTVGMAVHSLPAESVTSHKSCQWGPVTHTSLEAHG